MRIIVAHNTYRIRGGEDQVFEDEVALLEASGHDVTTFVRHNRDFSGLQTIPVAVGTVWNRPAASDMADLVRSTKADVVHVHNWLPQLSPAVFPAARASGAAVVQTAHNYRYTCAAGVLSRDGSVCEECVGRRVGWPALVHGCYRNSRAASVPVVATLAVHQALRTVDRSVDAVIVLSEFARSKMIEAGLPADRLHRKPNFVGPDPGARSGSGGYYVHLGRLVEDKGVGTLLDAWRRMPDAPTLKVAGSGPMERRVMQAAAASDNIEFLGRVDHDLVFDLLGDAIATILPSENYEGFPKTVVESLAVGTPIIASDIGSLTELIHPGTTGHLFEPGSADALIRTVSESASQAQMRHLREAARADYLANYTAEKNLDELIGIYEAAIRRRAST